MKRFLKIVYLIPIYFILILLNNIRFIFNNYRNHNDLFYNINIMNIKILLIALFLAGLLIIITNFKKYKYVIVSFSIIVLGISILNGIFVDKNLLNYIILYFYFIFAILFTSKLIKQPFQLSALIFICILVFIMTVLGITNLLFITKYIIICSAFIFLIGSVYFSVVNKNEIFESINNIILLIFSVLFLIFICGGINRYVHVYDEYSQWGFEAKATIHFDKLSTSEEIMSINRNYPPAMTLWHYFINIFTQSENESHFYIGLSMFILISLLPCFIYCNNKKSKIITILFGIIVYFSCYLFGGIYNYTNLYADYAMSAVFASSIVISYYFKNDDKKLFKYLLVVLGLLCLIKPTGIILSICLILIKALEDLYEKNEYKGLFKNLKKNIGFVIKKWWKFVLVLIGIFVLWNVYVKISDKINYNFYNFTLLPPSLDTSISAKLNAYTIAKTLGNFLKSFSDNILYGIINLSLYQYILIIISFSVFVLFIAKKNIKIIVPYLIGYICFTFLTFLSIFVMFTKYEAELLASFGRYLDSFHFAIFILLIVVVYKKISENNRWNEKKVIYTFILFTFILINIPFKKLIYFVNDYKLERMETLSISNDRNEKFKIVNENTPENAKVYILDQEDKDGIMAMWYGRYYCFPRKVNASSKIIGWKIKTNKNEYDLQDWGLNSNSFYKHLQDYDFDYVYLYTYDEELFEQLKTMFNENYLELFGKYTLFKIERNEGLIKLIPVA